MKRHQSHGSGQFEQGALGSCGADCVFEAGVLVFHPENVHLGENVYLGHRTILKGYYRGTLRIGDQSWVGQDCFLHAAGNITIGRAVGIGPAVKILTSWHAEAGRAKPILFSPIEFAPVVVEDDADIGVGAIVLPGVTVGRGAQIGAGAVVSKDVPPFAVVAGTPARILRYRPEGAP